LLRLRAAVVAMATMIASLQMTLKRWRHAVDEKEKERQSRESDDVRWSALLMQVEGQTGIKC
jgi:hypothetical protein